MRCEFFVRCCPVSVLVFMCGAVYGWVKTYSCVLLRARQFRNTLPRAGTGAGTGAGAGRNLSLGWVGGAELQEPGRGGGERGGARGGGRGRGSLRHFRIFWDSKRNRWEDFLDWCIWDSEARLKKIIIFAFLTEFNYIHLSLFPPRKLSHAFIFIIFLSQHTVRDATPFEEPD